MLITLPGRVSGAHFNPAVTMIFLLRREIPGTEALTYVIVKVISAVLGVWLAHLMFDLTIVQIADTQRTGVGR